MKIKGDGTKSGSKELDAKIEEAKNYVCPEFLRKMHLKWQIMPIITDFEQNKILN